MPIYIFENVLKSMEYPYTVQHTRTLQFSVGSWLVNRNSKKNCIPLGISHMILLYLGNPYGVQVLI